MFVLKDLLHTFLPAICLTVQTGVLYIVMQRTGEQENWSENIFFFFRIFNGAVRGVFLVSCDHLTLTCDIAKHLDDCFQTNFCQLMICSSVLPIDGLFSFSGKVYV